MQEILLAGGSGAYYPWSGPGNKRLVRGTRDLGYFGSLTTAELINDASLALAVGVQPQYGILNPLSSEQLWYKVMYNGRVIYFPKLAVMRNVNYLDIYNAGASDGVRGPGYNNPPSTGGVDQLKMLVKSEIVDGVRKYWPLKVALFQGVNDGTIPSSATYDTDQSEWDIILNKFLSEQWGGAALTWNNMSYSDAQWNWTRERNAAGTSAAMRGGSTLAPTGKSLVANATVDIRRVWRPKLELIRDQNIALGVYALQYEVTGAMGLPLMSIDIGESAPITAVQNVKALNSHQQQLAIMFNTLDSKVYLSPSTGGVRLAATTDTVDTIVGVSNVRRTHEMVPIGYSVSKGKEEIFAYTPAATINQAAVLTTVDASLVAPSRVTAINSAQSSNVGYRYQNVNGGVYASNNASVTLPPPTFTIEADS